IVLFDMLAGPDGTLMLDRTFTARRSALENFVRNNHDDAIRLSPATRDVTVARAWLGSAKNDETDGVVAKRLNGTYLRGERAMVKVKRLRTADC
ncbi:ATP-dependent DNA ligase, partial [Rhizobiaceae sp. 2RAB30]